MGRSVDGSVSEEIRPCLIGGFRWVSTTHPSYFDALQLGSDKTASIDMVRLRMKLSGSGGEWLLGHADTFDADNVESWTSKLQPGRFHVVWSFGLGDSSLSLGVGQMNPSCKIDMQRGFVEFNPNKVAGDDRLYRLLDKVSTCVVGADVVRYDLALDVAREQKFCRLSKDRRMYRSYVSNGITEELGVRNTDGHVRVYDKAAEADLVGPLTRVELTCSGSWSVNEVMEHWPKVNSWGCSDDSRSWVSLVGMLLSEKVDRGEEIESYLACLGYDARKKVTENLRHDFIELGHDAAEYAVSESRKWADRLCTVDY